MTDIALANANKRRDSLAAEINSLAERADELRRELAKIDAWIAQWHEFATVGTIAATEAGDTAAFSATVSAPKAGAVDKIETKRRRAAGNPKKEDVAEATRQIILERGEPISRADLFRTLGERGITILSETDPEMVLSTMLWRMRDKVVRLKTGGYWLTERPYPKAGYNPAETSAELEDVLGFREGELPISVKEEEAFSAEAG